MQHLSLTSPANETMEFRAFEATPGLRVLVLPDAPAYTIKAVSNDFISMSGLKRTELIEKTYLDVFYSNPDITTQKQDLLASFSYVSTHKETHWLSLQHFSIPGQKEAFQFGYWDICNAPMLDDDGKLLFIIHTVVNSNQQVKSELYSRQNIVVTFQEITKQRESALLLERQKNLLDNILKHSPNGISVYVPIRDEENKIIDFQCIVSNHAAEVFTQISNEERLAKTVLEITPGLRDSALFQKAVSTIESGQSFQTQYYHTPIHKWLDLSVIKIDDNHLINVFTDITSTKEAQHQLEQSIQELQQSNEELQQFAYVASHDLQEPLRKIRIYNNILSEKIEPESKLHQYVNKVESSIVRMSGLIKSLLDYSRLSKSTLRFEQVDLNAILQNVLTDYELLISQKEAIVSSNDLPKLEAIPLQMNQLFFNLIGNALKFAKKGVPPRITIRGNTLSDERKRSFPQLQSHKNYIELTIQDNGIGFNQEYANKIFTIFQRLNERSLFDGYGIGLALCKKVADTHNGFIYAEGKLKEGAAFTILLPDRQD